ncbi:MAG: hypothetical protein WCS52_02060 [bacterium]
MAKITEADFGGKEELELHVKIVSPHFESAEKDGDKARMALVLRGETKSGMFIDCYQYFTRQIIASGRNKGKTMFEVSAEQCHALGMPKPFNPKDIAMLDGVECVYVVGLEEYEGKTRPRVKFINSGRKPALSLDDAASIFAELSGEAPMTATARTAPAAEVGSDPSDDGLPF